VFQLAELEDDTEDVGQMISASGWDLGLTIIIIIIIIINRFV